MKNLYNEAGFINIPEIASRPSWLKVIIGARQVGKTYGTLKYHLENNIPFILLRRTTEELEFIGTNSELDPFRPFLPDFHVKLVRRGHSFQIMDYDGEGKPIKDSSRGVALSLPQIAHIRGFSGSMFQSIIFDEFIPEKGVITRKTEGDSLLNAYTTINGNRELQGLPPCTLWLLANTNNINSKILDALNLSDIILKMNIQHMEFWENDSISIFQGKSQTITSQRKETALAKLVGQESQFSQMAYDNEWAYNKSPLIKPQSLKNLSPLASIESLYLWEGPQGIYICKAPHKISRYAPDDYSKTKFTTEFSWLPAYYASGLVTFSDVLTLARFQQLFNINY